MRCVQCAHELSCNAPRRGHWNEVQEAVEAENKKDHARQISGDYGSGSHKPGSPFRLAPLHDVNYIDVNRIDGVCFWEIQLFYDARLSRDGPRLAGNDEGDARSDEVCSRWH